MSETLPFSELWGRIASFADANGLRALSSTTFFVLMGSIDHVEKRRQIGQLAYLAAEQKRLSQELGRPVIVRFQ